MAVNIEQLKKEVGPLAKQFLVLSDFQRAYPQQYRQCYNARVTKHVFPHMKRMSDITKSDALDFATNLTVEDLFTDHRCLAGKIARDGYMLEILGIIERKSNGKPAPF